MKTLMFGIIFCLVLLLPKLLQAQDELKVSELNVFKNGTYFVVKEGNVRLAKGKARISMPPNPLLATYWLTTTKDVSISKVVFKPDTIKTLRKLQNFFELLKSNPGQHVVVQYRINDKELVDISGIIEDFYTSANILKLKQDDGKMGFIFISDIRKLLFDKAPVETAPQDSVVLTGNLEFGKFNENPRLKLVYMQTGIQWAPSYNIKILNDNELQLEMRALVENFAETIDDASLTLTVGDPYFKFGRNVELFINTYLTSLYSPQPVTTNRYMYQNSTYAPRGSTTESEYPGYTDIQTYNYNDYTTYTTEGEKTNDLYMYSLGKVSIPRNSKASFMVFSQKIPYKDVYTCSIADFVNYAGNYTINLDPEKRYDVFHSFKLSNTTKNPLTTAPVFVQNENLQPLAQDEIKYTPVGGEVSVQLSKAVDVSVKNNEEEINKVEKAKVIGKLIYNKITIRGTIEVKNLQGRKIVLNMNKSVNAGITEVSDNGIIKKSGKYNGQNPYSSVSWEIPVKENETKTITYEYEVYVIAR